LRHIRDLCICAFNSLGVHAAVAFREKLFKRVSLFFLKCLSSRFSKSVISASFANLSDAGGLAWPKQMGAATINAT
jgi:hypothetical protein